MISCTKVCVLLLVTISYLHAQDPVANVPQGRIVGIKVYAENSVTPIEIYFGVPYAIPPVGRYRFSAPERHTGWRRTFYAHRMPPRCPQAGDEGNNNFNEDCLYLNIWTPRGADGKGLPVVVILYSETWFSSGTALPCQELAAEGLVVVTVAYRLHLLAFFNLRSKLARGNLALLDQYLALLWVRDNIAAFGGDPTAITLIGHSAGADSVLQHIISPRSVGLFQRAIVMSPRDIWKAFDGKRGIEAVEVERISRDAARVLGCNASLDEEILNCLRIRTLSEIVSVNKNTRWTQAMQPVPDTYLSESERYLPTSLSTALSATKQPAMQLDLLLGTTDLEVLNDNDKKYEELMKQSPQYISDYANTILIPEILQMFSLNQTDFFPTLIKAIRWEYWGTNSWTGVMTTLEAIEYLARIESSAKWGCGTALLAARLARGVQRLYVYRYSQPGTDLAGRRYNYTGAVHGTDLVSLLGDALMLQVARRPSTADEKRISSQFRHYIVNFIKYGSPSLEDQWRRYRVGDAHIFDISSSSIKQNSPSREGMFWLQYLPEIANRLTNSEQTEKLVSETGETRLRGGVFAMCGVSVVLLSLLCACAVLLRRERSRRRFSVADDTLH